MNTIERVAAVVLAAGEGTRMKARKKNKVAYKLAGKPMIRYVIDALSRLGLKHIVVVVKFFEASVKTSLRGAHVSFVRQGEKKGTAAALQDGLKAIPKNVEQIIVMYGDDSAFYSERLFQFLLREHDRSGADVTLLSIKVEDPVGLGRIIRDKRAHPIGIVEEKSATDEQKLIKEINTGCYCFRREFIEKRIDDIKINSASQEYYLTDIVEVALTRGEKVHVCLYPDSSVWFGVNTRSQWAKARELMGSKIGGEPK